jgi:hypothetical protein
MKILSTCFLLVLMAGMAVAQSAQPEAAPTASSPLVFMVLLVKQLLNIAGWIVVIYLILFYVKKKFGKVKSESLRRYEALIEVAEDMCPDSLKGYNFEIGHSVDIGGHVMGVIAGVGKLPVSNEWNDPNAEFPDDYSQKVRKVVPYNMELLFVIRNAVGIMKYPLFSSLAKKKVYRVPCNLKHCPNVMIKDGKRYKCGAPVRHNPLNSVCWRCGGPIPVYHSQPLAGDVRIYSSGFDKVSRFYFPNERDDGEILHTLELDSVNIKYLQLLDASAEIVQSALQSNPKLQMKLAQNESEVQGTVAKK